MKWGGETKMCDQCPEGEAVPGLENGGDGRQHFVEQCLEEFIYL